MIVGSLYILRKREGRKGTEKWGQKHIFFHPFLRVSGEDGEKKQNLNPF